jgi:hypothetical protein
VPAPVPIGLDRNLEEIGDVGRVGAEQAEAPRLPGIFRAITGCGNSAGRRDFPCSDGGNREINREMRFFGRFAGVVSSEIVVLDQGLVGEFPVMPKQGIRQRGTGNCPPRTGKSRSRWDRDLIQPCGGIGFQGGDVNHGRSRRMAGSKVESRKSGAGLRSVDWAGGVGYGKPPVDHRFRKGQSGNPAGRPRATGAPGDRLRGSTEPGREMILAEAYRRVMVEEDGAEIELSTHEAVLRAMATAARQGNQTAQYRWIQLVKAAEAEQKRAQIALYNVLERENLKREWSDSEGRMVVSSSYRDDIVVDSHSGTVVVREVPEGDGSG